MRVISGTARGCRLIAPQGLKTRPTGDRMKEDLFNILAPMIQEAIFMDMYCGSGAMGIEALSRGAKTAVFIDASNEATAATEANLLKTRLKDRAVVLHMPVSQALVKLQKQRQRFDIVFMDPPYGSEELILSLDFISKWDFLAKKGIVVVECSLDAKLPDIIEEAKLAIYRRKEYSQMQFVFYKRCEKKGRDNQ